MVISIEKSTSIKGIAVLMMLYLHIFHGKQVEYLDRSYDIWTYNGISFSEYLGYAANPVQIYVILSGYGLYKVYERGKLSWNNQLKRVGKLYVAYWITLLLFLPFVFVVNPSLFKLEWSYIWGSLTAIGPFYYLPAWFLFPYVLLSLLSPFLIKYMSSKPIVGGAISCIIFSINGYYLSYSVSHHIDITPLLKQIIWLGFFFLSFYIGIMLGKCNHNNYWWQLKSKPACIILLVCAVIAEILLNSYATYPIYALVLIICMTGMVGEGPISKMIYMVGKYSMPMWFIHFYISFLYSPNFIYGLKYPIIMYMVLVIITFLASVPTLKIIKTINCYLFR